MLALISAVMFFIIAAVQPDHEHQWLLVAFGVFVLHFAFDFALPAFQRRPPA